MRGISIPSCEWMCLRVKYPALPILLNCLRRGTTRYTDLQSKPRTCGQWLRSVELMAGWAKHTKGGKAFLKSLQMLVRCHSLHLVPKRHGVTSSLLRFASLCLPLCPDSLVLQGTDCTLLALQTRPLYVASAAGDNKHLLFFAILTLMTMRWLVQLQC